MGNVESHIDLDESGMPERVWLSAKHGWGIEQLYEAIGLALDNGHWVGNIRLTPNLGQLRAQLFAMGVIESEEYDVNGNAILAVNIPIADLNRLSKKLSIDWQEFVVDDIG
jgi:GTP-binding protein HflX